jgi:DNA-binding transcriptional regulator YiaG
MPTFASVLQKEIARVSRKESRVESQSLKKSSSQYRTDIAALKRRVLSLEQLVSRLRKAQSPAKAPVPAKHPGVAFEFSAQAMSAQRSRLGLSAVQLGKLLGVSDQSVNKWEKGTSHPRAGNFPALAALKGLSKKVASERLAEMGA